MRHYCINGQLSSFSIPARLILYFTRFQTTVTNHNPVRNTNQLRIMQ